MFQNIGNLKKNDKVSSCSRLSLETQGTRLFVSSRSCSTLDFQKVSVSDSSICQLFKKSRSRSHHKILVSQISETAIIKDDPMPISNGQNIAEPRMFNKTLHNYYKNCGWDCLCFTLNIYYDICHEISFFPTLLIRLTGPWMNTFQWEI